MVAVDGKASFKIRYSVPDLQEAVFEAVLIYRCTLIGCLFWKRA